MTISFTKYSGTGNTFLFFDARTEAKVQTLYRFFNTRSRAKIARALCDNYHGVGADGLVFVENSVHSVNKIGLSADLVWDFYNSDGSSAEMCGNASRCMALYAHKLGVKKQPLRFMTRAGIVSCELSNLQRGSAIVDVEMPQISAFALEQTLRSGKEKFPYAFVNTGVPHAVIEVKSSLDPMKMTEKDFLKLSAIDKKFKSHSRFQPKSTNVTFYKVLKPGFIESFTFERGVKGYTQACGTGAVAAAVVYRFDHRPKHAKVKLKLPGGTVWVDLSGAHPHLIGPAKEIADITLSH